MQNLEQLQLFTETLPEALKANAQALLSEITTPVEGIGDDPVPWRPGFLKLVQGTTDRGSLPKGTSIGDFVLGEKKLEQPLKFIPIRIWDSRQYWDPDQNNAKMLCSSPDAKFGMMGRECRGCPHSEWKDEGGVDCTKTKSVMAMSADMSSVFTINFSKSNYKVGMELEALMKRAAVVPYARTYGLTSATSSTAKNVENYKIEVLDEKLRRTPEELIPFLKELFTIITNDRKASVEGFYKIAYDRRDKLVLENAAAALAISNEAGALGGTEEALVVSETPTKANVSSMAKNYSV